MPRSSSTHLRATGQQRAKPFAGRSRAVGFVVACYVLATALALALPGTEQRPGPIALLTLLVPTTVVGAMALIDRLRRQARPLPPFGLRRLGLRQWPIAILLPVVAIGASFGIARVLGVVRFVDLGSYLVEAPISLAVLTVLVLGEELGWRGFLLGELLTTTPPLPPRRASLIVGIVQAGFHLPLLLIAAGYDSAGSRWIVVPGVMIVISAAGIVFGWLRIRSASLIPVLLAHAAVNVCLLEAPTLVADHPAVAAALTGEGGIITAVTVIAVAATVWHLATWTSAVAPSADL
jgi:CAAX protease family protein